MTEVLHSPSQLPSSPSTTAASFSSSLTCAPPQSPSPLRQDDVVRDGGEEDFAVIQGDPEEELAKEREKNRSDQLSLLALLLTLLRKSLAACKSDRRELCAMEIGWPSNVRHVAHVTFDRFNGFLGLPVEFEPEVPRRAPSASATVFGVSTESMQLSYDSRENSVPTILLLMQKRLYAQGGLQAEGIFRINAENSQEEHVRGQLNRGDVPEGIDVHCLAGLIKAWFRELPRGVLDSLLPEQVMQCQTEEDCVELVRHLPSAESALLDWAINLMADVVEQEHINKMNARNIAVVFAPNMTHMANPLTALMYAVRVMNFLKTLISRTLREREDSVVEPTPASRLDPFDENGHQSPLRLCIENTEKDHEKTDKSYTYEEPVIESSCNCNQNSVIADGEECLSTNFVDNLVANGDQSCETASQIDTILNETHGGRAHGLKAGVQTRRLSRKSKLGRSSDSCLIKGPVIKTRQQSIRRVTSTVGRGICNLSRIDSRAELIEAWR